MFTECNDIRYNVCFFLKSTPTKYTEAHMIICYTCRSCTSVVLNQEKKKAST